MRGFTLQLNKRKNKYIKQRKMKNLGLMVMFIALTSFTLTNKQDADNKVATVTVLTSAVCGECKELSLIHI